jgi:hypothetical protein
MFNIVFNQGDKASHIYLVKNGDFAVYKQMDMPTKLKNEIRDSSEKNIFL